MALEIQSQGHTVTSYYQCSSSASILFYDITLVELVERPIISSTKQVTRLLLASFNGNLAQERY